MRLPWRLDWRFYGRARWPVGVVLVALAVAGAAVLAIVGAFTYIIA